MRCLDCHYSLENLTENRCPECGRPFDPTDPTTFEGERLSRGRRVLLLAIGCCTYIASFYYLFMSDGPASDQRHLLSDLGAIAFVALIPTLGITLLSSSLLIIVSKFVARRTNQSPDL